MKFYCPQTCGLCRDSTATARIASLPTTETDTTASHILGMRVTSSNCEVGLLVARGNDWKWDNQDFSPITGKPTSGKITFCGHMGLGSGMWAVVQWADGGKENSYRIGAQNAYDLVLVSGCKRVFVKNTCAAIGTPPESRLTPQNCWNYCVIKSDRSGIIWKSDLCGCVHRSNLGSCNIGTQEDFEYYESIPTLCIDEEATTRSAATPTRTTTAVSNTTTTTTTNSTNTTSVASPTTIEAGTTEYPCRKLRLTVEGKPEILLTLHPMLSNNRVVYQFESGFLFSYSSHDKAIDGTWSLGLDPTKHVAWVVNHNCRHLDYPEECNNNWVIYNPSTKSWNTDNTITLTCIDQDGTSSFIDKQTSRMIEFEGSTEASLNKS